MKVIRLNENDIERLVKKIIKEEGENLDWTNDVKPYDLIGIYVRKPVQKLTGVSEGEVLEVSEVNGQEAKVFLSYNINAVISGYPYSSEGPYEMDVNDLIQDIQDGILVKYEKPISESRLFEEENDDLNWVKDIGEYDLTGTYTSKPIKSDFYIDSEIIDVVNIKGQKAKVYVIPISTTLNSEDGEIELPQGDMDNWLRHEILHYLAGSKGREWRPHSLDVNVLIQGIQDGILVKYEKPISESRLFGEPKKTADERIAEYILQKLEKERPDIQYQHITREMGYNNFFEIKGVEAEHLRVDFNNKSPKITLDDKILQGGDFGVLKVYNESGGVNGYAVKMTGHDVLDIPHSLAKKIWNRVDSQYDEIKVFKAQRRLDKGTDDESDIFDQLTQ
jgi:hypothetical protein